MDGVFMKKLLKIIGLCALVAFGLWFASVLADRVMLRQNVIRLHVVANSDAAEDQAVKLRVRDAVNLYIGENMAADLDPEAARSWLTENLDRLAEVADATLEQAGFQERVTVRLTEEAFPIRRYDSFTLPSGVYSSLRITIGDGVGKNWWCVIFPSLCVSAVSQTVEDTAAGAGFSDGLTGAIQGQSGYEIRFFFLDWLGKIENFLFSS